jgi:hypothetical protein
LVEKLPGWVARYGALIEERKTWVYCEPHPGAESGLAGQILLRMPDGRSFVDCFDAASATCIARESAGSTPLVVGLPFTGGPILLWIRPIGCAPHT